MLRCERSGQSAVATASAEQNKCPRPDKFARYERGSARPALPQDCSAGYLAVIADRGPWHIVGDRLYLPTCGPVRRLLRPARTGPCGGQPAGPTQGSPVPGCGVTDSEGSPTLADVTSG